jgi:preprotein translocase subunit SecA
LIGDILKRIIGTKHERDIRKLMPIVEAINRLEPQMMKLTDAELRAKTDEFKKRLSAGETLDDLLIEAYAVVREAARRFVGMRPFDVQVMGAIVLHQGKIAEMKTGEGKTLVATMPLYLNALTGRGVHLVTQNDYLAKRDRYWMGPIYENLGLTVGLLQHDMPEYSEQRKQAYAADITYGMNSEFGFDYLRDNMAMRKEDRVQRGHYYAIVDEVDCILIDEARTPHIISGPVDESPDLYYKVDKVVRRLRKDVDFQLDEKTQTVWLTDEGVTHVEILMGVKNLADDIKLMHHIIQALKAHHFFKLDRDYIIRDGKVLIVDEFTGRVLEGRRWSDGLHQAIEAKEGLRIERENQTLATISLQNYFRLYEKLAGMTGTADTEAAEFKEIYGLDVVVIPTHKPMIRIDYPDVVYKTEKEKFKAVVREIKELYRIGRPVLVGTTSIEKSEMLSEMLRKEGIPHQVLNAKHHEKEAMIIAQAGRKGAVTIATNMAGRGVDIILGGNPPDPEEQEEVKRLGGLHVIGTERHESRRIDNQLRGRSGRQGDPGSSRFYVSLEDDLMRMFGSDRIKPLMEKLGMKEDEPIEHPWVTKAIERAQKSVEAHNFEIRKHLLEYDDVMNVQREIIYEQRRMVLEGEDMKDEILEMIEDVIRKRVDIYCPPKTSPDEWDLVELCSFASRVFRAEIDPEEIKGLSSRDEIAERIIEEARKAYDRKESEIGSEMMRQVERMILLSVIDSKWKDHLYNMDLLRESVGLRAYGQKDPLVEYKREAHEMFQDMIERIKEDVTEYIFRVQVTREEPFQRRVEVKEVPSKVKKGKKEKRKTKIGRNDPCPCGSGLKYKKCHGKGL